MKDATHHLKHVQRKIIQSARKEQEYSQIAEVNYTPINGEDVWGKRLSSEAPRRDTRLPNHHNIH